MTYTPHFCNVMLDHYSSLTSACDEQQVIINRTLRMYTKQLRQHESMATYINHDHIIYCNYYPTPEGLTRPERQAHALLSEVTAKTIIGIGIGTGLAAGTLPAFRELIKELQDCIEDNPKVMQGVLGNECFEAVIKLGYNNVLHK